MTKSEINAGGRRFSLTHRLPESSLIVLAQNWEITISILLPGSELL